MRGTPEIKKRQLIADLTSARRELLATAAATLPEGRDTPFLGAWSVHDIVAHLVGWDLANLEAIHTIAQGHLPAFYAHFDSDWRTFNAGLVAQYKRSTLDETMIAAQTSQRLLLDTVDALPAENMIQDSGVRSPRGRHVTVAMLLSAETQDERRHCEQIRTFNALSSAAA